MAGTKRPHPDYEPLEALPEAQRPAKYKKNRNTDSTSVKNGVAVLPKDTVVTDAVNETDSVADGCTPMEDVVSSDESGKENPAPKMTARLAVKHGKHARAKAILKKAKDKESKALTKAVERKLAAKSKAQTDSTSDDEEAVQSDNEKAVQADTSSYSTADGQTEQKPFVPKPDEKHRLIPVDAHNAPEDDSSCGRKKAIKGEEDPSLLHVLCYDSGTGAKRELHFAKIVTDEIDWNLSKHIAAINAWRTQIWSRAGYKMKNVTLYHETEDDWLELFISLSVAQGLKKPVRFASVNYIVDEFNKFFDGKTLKNADGTDSEPRPKRTASSFASKVGRVLTTVKKVDPGFETAMDKEAREFKPTITEAMLKTFQDEKVKLLGGSRDTYKGKKKVPRIEQSICESLIKVCAQFLDDGKPAKSTRPSMTTSASAGSSRRQKDTSNSAGSTRTKKVTAVSAGSTRTTRSEKKRQAVVSALEAKSSSSSDDGWYTVDSNESSDEGSHSSQSVAVTSKDVSAQETQTSDHAVEALDAEMTDISDEDVCDDVEESGASSQHDPENGMVENVSVSSSEKEDSEEVATEVVKAVEEAVVDDAENAAQNGSNDGSSEEDGSPKESNTDEKLFGGNNSNSEPSGESAAEVPQGVRANPPRTTNYTEDEIMAAEGLFKLRYGS